MKIKEKVLTRDVTFILSNAERLELQIEGQVEVHNGMLNFKTVEGQVCYINPEHVIYFIYEANEPTRD